MSLYESIKHGLKEAEAFKGDYVTRKEDGSILIVDQYEEEYKYSNVDEAISDFEDKLMNFELEDDEANVEYSQEIIDELYSLTESALKESAYGTIYLAEVGYNGVVGTCRGIGHTPEEARMNAFKLFKKDYPYLVEELMERDDFKDMTEIDAVREYYSINTFDMSSGASNEANSHL